MKLMILRMAASALALFAATTGALAQSITPPDKFSMRPVSPSAQVRGDANPQSWPLIRSRWAPACGDIGAGPDAKPICPKKKGLSLEVGGTGRLIFATVSLAEAPGEERKVFGAEAPRDLQRSSGLRLLIGGDMARTGIQHRCLNGGCVWEFAVDADFVARLKTAERLYLEGVGVPGQGTSYALPLGEFARVNDSPPPTRPKP
jgi:invasion protein IalB